MFTHDALPRAIRLCLTLLLAGIASTLISTPAIAMLILDPVDNAPITDNKASLSKPLSNGFLPVVFQPGIATSPQVIRWRLETKLPASAKALNWHIQNTMPWPVTIDMSLAGASGGTLTTRIALPPGPPQTFVMPLQSVAPLMMGMRAAPPQPFFVGNEPVLVATSVQGELKGSPKAVSISMPAPDVDQTILLGKLFVRPDRDDLASLYEGLIDCFGQFTRRDWPGKWQGQCESGETEPSRTTTDAPAVSPEISIDRFGGLLIPGWPAATLASGAFRTYRLPDRRDGKPARWVLLTPLGNPFFSLGVNAVQLNNSETFIEGREAMFTALPDEQSALSMFYGNRDSTDVLAADAGAQQGRGFKSGRTYDFYRANLYRADGSDYPQRWQQRTANRLRQWSFNTAAAWSDESFIQDSSLSYTAIIHIEGPFQRLSDGHNWWQGIPDPFDPAFKQALIDTYSKVVPTHRNNERLIGYFVDNELAWGDGSAGAPGSRYGPALSALAMNAKDVGAFAKRAFIKHLKLQYGDIDHLAQAWRLPLSSWQQLDPPILNDRAALHAQLKNNSNLASDLSKLLALHARKYYELVSETLRSFDPDHLYLGSRFASRTPEAVKACVQFCDVISFNLYVPDIESGFEAEAFAEHDKPALLTEFHFGSTDRGPFWGGVMRVARAQDRGPAYKKMIESVVNNPQFVGAHWFQYLDQATTGRWLDGENGHLGLVSITDTPWHEFTANVSETNEAALQQITEQLRQAKR